MKSTASFAIISLLATAFADGLAAAPKGCLKLSKDADWPSIEVWKAQLPGVIPRDAKSKEGPDYRLRPKSAVEVQKAVKFAKDYNVRLSIVVSGHDIMGRSDAASGLLVDVSTLRGVKILESFEPSVKGADSALGLKRNIITPKDGVQAAVTFGAGTTAEMLYESLSPSKLFPMTAGHGEVSIAGGWSQFGGHGPFTNRYGLGADQWLEAKVVTADGELKIANKVSNPDLFWAIRGGGGGAFGVVVEATMKVYPDLPITTIAWWINTTAPTSQGFEDATKYFVGQVADLHAQGVGGAVYARGTAFRGYNTHIGNISGTATTNAIWKPVLEKLQSFPSMTKFQSRTFNFKNFKEFYDITFPHENAMPVRKRHGPGGDNAIPVSYGHAHMDTHLLAPTHLKSPKIAEALKTTGGNWIMIMAAPLPGVADASAVSAHPSWRKASVHFVGLGAYAGLTNGSNIRTFAPELGVYGNEGDYEEPDWKHAFWGESYDRLSEIKTRYDPTTMFWVTPGIHADKMRAVEDRVCQVGDVVATKSRIAPAGDLQKMASAQVMMERFGGAEMKLNFPAPGKMEGFNA